MMILVIEFSLQFPTFVFGHSRSQSAENFILRTKDFLKSSWGGRNLCIRKDIMIERWIDEDDYDDDDDDADGDEEDHEDSDDCNKDAGSN